MTRRILLLDDEINVLSALKRSLRQIYSSHQLEIETFTNAQQAIQRFATVEFDFVISDFHMPNMDGVGFLRVIREIQPLTLRMMLSASADFNTVMSAINEAEVFRYIPKPWVQSELIEIIEAAFAQHDQLLEDKRLSDQQRAQQNPVSAQEKEAQQLEDSEPGITQVNWGPDGSVRLD